MYNQGPLASTLSPFSVSLALATSPLFLSLLHYKHLSTRCPLSVSPQRCHVNVKQRDLSRVCFGQVCRLGGRDGMQGMLLNFSLKFSLIFSLVSVCEVFATLTHTCDPLRGIKTRRAQLHEWCRRIRLAAREGKGGEWRRESTMRRPTKQGHEQRTVMVRCLRVGYVNYVGRCTLIKAGIRLAYIFIHH